MTVIKRDRSSSSKDLVGAIDALVGLLETQGEEDAIAALKDAAKLLKKHVPGSAEHSTAVKAVVDAFEGDHELSSYILAKPDTSQWTETEELSLQSTRVLNLAKRLR